MDYFEKIIAAIAIIAVMAIFVYAMHKDLRATILASDAAAAAAVAAKEAVRAIELASAANAAVFKLISRSFPANQTFARGSTAELYLSSAMSLATPTSPSSSNTSSMLISTLNV